MIPTTQLCKQREIRTFNLHTPILVPSLSSKGFPDIDWIWKNVCGFLTDTALISSYDVSHGYLEKVVGGPSLLFIDSGGYEARLDHDLPDHYRVDHHPKEWTRESHQSILPRIETFASKVIISFDDLDNEVDIATQIENAKNLFSEFDDDATDFLLKPYGSTHLDPSDIQPYINQLEEFDVIGVTEKELGRSIRERLQCLVRLRLELINNDLETPIHVFGCLEPISIWLYYLCGADVFDGLSWLRYAFRENLPIYRHAWATLTDNEDLTDPELFLLASEQNIGVLRRQRIAMTQYASSYEQALLPLDQERMEAILNASGVTTERS